jgi:hypothetical protein
MTCMTATLIQNAIDKIPTAVLPGSTASSISYPAVHPAHFTRASWRRIFVQTGFARLEPARPGCNVVSTPIRMLHHGDAACRLAAKTMRSENHRAATIGDVCDAVG